MTHLVYGIFMLKRLDKYKFSPFRLTKSKKVGYTNNQTEIERREKYMKCLRCGAEMKQYSKVIGIYGAEQHDMGRYFENPHNINSVYICEECGYAEFSIHECNNPDK